MGWQDDQVVGPAAPAAGSWQNDEVVAPAPQPRGPVAGGLMGAADLGLSGLSHIISSVVKGLAATGMRFGGMGNPNTEQQVGDMKQWVDQNATYHTQTPEGQDAARMLTDAAGKVTAPLQRFDQKVDQAVGPTVAGAIHKTSEVAGDLANALPVGMAAGEARAGLDAATAAREAVVGKPGEAPISATTRIAADKEYLLRPSDVEKANPAAKVPGTMREGLQNKSAFEKKAVLHNAAVNTRRAGEDIGIKNATNLDDHLFETAREPHIATYESAGRAAGKWTPSQQYMKDLQSAAGDIHGLDPKDADAIHAVVARFAGQQGEMSGADMVKTVSSLRRRSSMQLRSEIPAQQELGFTNRRIADAIEDEVGRQLRANGVPKLAQEWDDARTALAKIHDVETALSGGQVDPAVLSRLQAKTGKLSANLKDIAELHDTFPGVMKHPTKAPSGGAKPETSTMVGAIKHGATALVRKIPGLDVSRQSFTRKLGDMAEKPVGREPKGAAPTPKKQLGDQLDMIGPNIDLQAPEGNAAFRRQDLGPQGEMFGAPPTEELALANPAGTAPRIPMLPSQPTRQDLLLGDQLALTPPEGSVGPVYAPLGQQLEALGPVPTESLMLRAPDGTAPALQMPPSQPTRQELLLGEILQLQAPPGRVGPSVFRRHPKPSSGAWDQIDAFPSKEP